MKILIVSHVIIPYQSPRSFRTTELAIELAKNHDVTLIANIGGADYSKFDDLKNIELRSFSNLLFIKKHSVKQEKYSLTEKIFLKLFRRYLMYPNIEFLWKIPQTLKHYEGYDILISIAAPHMIHWGCDIALLRNPNLAKKWIADCGDPFMMNTSERPPVYFSYFERRFMKRANFISIPIENAKDAYYPEFRSKLRVIPQGFNFEGLNINREPITNEVPTFAYSGVFYKDIRDPDIFFKYLSKLKRNFKFIIYTKDDSLIKTYKQTLKDKIIVRPYVPREALLWDLSCMDFLINFGNKTKTQLPSKLIDYALTERPILDIDLENFEEKTFVQFLDGNYESRMKINIADYDIRKIANRFLDLTLE